MWQLCRRIRQMVVYVYLKKTIYQRPETELYVDVVLHLVTLGRTAFGENGTALNAVNKDTTLGNARCYLVRLRLPTVIVDRLRSVTDAVRPAITNAIVWRVKPTRTWRKLNYN